MKTGPILLALASCCVGFGAGAPAQAEEIEGGRFYGMLRQRDLTPFGFLRLDMRPAHAMNIEPHSFAFEMELGYQNTWALSRDVEKYLTGLEPQGRRVIGPAEVEEIRDLPGENYLLDLESATLDMVLHYKLSSQWRCMPSLPPCRITADSWIRASKDSTTRWGSAALAVRPSRATGPVSSIDLKGAQVGVARGTEDPGFMDPTFGPALLGYQTTGPLADVGGDGRQGAARR